MNPDHLRYELHRVWVVDATLKKGERHIYKRRTFYIDEDSWQILLVDQYDNRDQLWRVSEGHAITYYDLPTVWTSAEVPHGPPGGALPRHGPQQREHAARLQHQAHRGRLHARRAPPRRRALTSRGPRRAPVAGVPCRRRRFSPVLDLRSGRRPAPPARRSGGAASSPSWRARAALAPPRRRRPRTGCRRGRRARARAPLPRRRDDVDPGRAADPDAPHRRLAARRPPRVGRRPRRDDPQDPGRRRDVGAGPRHARSGAAAPRRLVPRRENGLAIGAYGALPRDRGRRRHVGERTVSGDDTHLNHIAEAGGSLYIAGGGGPPLPLGRPRRKSWQALAVALRGLVLRPAAASDGGLLAFGLRGHVFRTDDRGTTWTASTPAPRRR